MGIHTDEFKRLAREHIKDKYLAENFIEWCNCIELKLVDGDYKEEWGEGGARGNVYTIYKDFYDKQVNSVLCEVAFMLHEYYHHVLDRVLWNKITTSKSFFTIKERNFIEDMYINAWLRSETPEVSSEWEQFLIAHDDFHKLNFTKEEKPWNSLLTSRMVPCHNSLTLLYERIHENDHEFLDPRRFAYFASMWRSILKEDSKVKKMLNTMQINKEEWSYETHE